MYEGRPDENEVRVRVPVRARMLSSGCQDQTGSGTHPAIQWEWRALSQLQLLPKSRKREYIQTHVLMA
jgi:hypothetical protein